MKKRIPLKVTFLTRVCVVAAWLSFFSLESNAAQRIYNQGIHVIPQPASFIQDAGFFLINKNTAFSASSKDAKSIAGFFADKMRLSTGYAFPVNQNKNANTISLQIDPSLDLNEQGYLLKSSRNGVQIEAKTPQGLFYGMQTLLQLLPAEIEQSGVVKDVVWQLPCVRIKDEPRFGYRGMMLDVCRHFIPVENIKKQLDIMAMFKINNFHWHLTDDQGWRIEIKKYPRLTEVGSKRVEGEGNEYGGFYTQEQIKEIVAYAGARFINVIPEIEMPGHALAAIAAYPELSCLGEKQVPRNIWGIEDDVYCAGKDETFRFLEEVIAEVVPLFPGKYFHIGGDECPKIRWKECPLCQKRMQENGLKDEHELQSYFVQRMEKVLTGYGKKMIGWDEILEGGLAPSATVMSWRGEAGGIAAANLNHDVIMTPGSKGMYLDHYQGDSKLGPVAIGGFSPLEKVYSYNPVPDTLAAGGKSRFILGAQCNVWTEYIYNTDILEYRAYPRALALAELDWTPLAKKDYNDFLRRLGNALVRLDAHDIHYYIPLPEQPGGSLDLVAFTDKATLAFTTSWPVKMVYTLDGTEPTANSSVYQTPIGISQSTTLKIRSVLLSGKMSRTRTIQVEKQALSPAKEIKDAKPGLKMKVTPGYFLKSSELAQATEWKEQTIRDLKEIAGQVKNNSGVRKEDQYAAIATGYIRIPEDGIYYFSTELEEVWIDGKLLIDNGGEVKRFSGKDASMALSKGDHEIKVVFLGHIIGGFLSNRENGALNFHKSDSQKFEKVTPNMLWYTE